MDYKVTSTDKVEIISAERADKIGFNCMTPRPPMMNEVLILSARFQRPTKKHELFMGQDGTGQFYLKCETLAKDQWAATFANGV